MDVEKICRTYRESTRHLEKLIGEELHNSSKNLCVVEMGMASSGHSEDEN
jgi:hypothetical protein